MDAQGQKHVVATATTPLKASTAADKVTTTPTPRKLADELINVAPPSGLRSTFAKPKTIDYYGTEVHRTFAYNMATLDWHVVTDGAKEIVNSAKTLQQKIFMNDTPITDKTAPELDRATDCFQEAISRNYIYKAIFVGHDPRMFKRYFSELSSHSSWFNIANSMVSAAILKKFPVLQTIGKLRNDERELPAILEAMLEIRSLRSTLVKPKTIDYYGTEVHRTFAYNMATLDWHVVTDGAKEIANSAKTLQQKIFMNDTPITDKTAPELDRATDCFQEAISRYYIYKAIFVGHDPDMFKRYFSELSSHSSWFNDANSMVSAAILKKFPVLQTIGKLRNDERELPAILRAMLEIRTENLTYNSNRINDAFDMVHYCVMLWKGTTDEGLALIISLVTQFKMNFPEQVYTPEQYLARLITGYDSGTDQLLRQWYQDEYGSVCGDLVEMAKRFQREKRPQLSQLGHIRMDEQLSASDRTRKLFKQTIAGCEHDFHPLRPRSVQAAAEIHSNSVKHDPKEKDAQAKDPKARQSHYLPFHKPMQIIMEQLAKNPNLCPNCIITDRAEHKLEDCPKLLDDPRENLAAYLDPKYSSKAKQRYYPHLAQMAHKASTPNK